MRWASVAPLNALTASPGWAACEAVCRGKRHLLSWTLNFGGAAAGEVDSSRLLPAGDQAEDKGHEPNGRPRRPVSKEAAGPRPADLLPLSRKLKSPSDSDGAIAAHNNPITFLRRRTGDSQPNRRRCAPPEEPARSPALRLRSSLETPLYLFLVAMAFSRVSASLVLSPSSCGSSGGRDQPAAAASELHQLCRASALLAFIRTANRLTCTNKLLLCRTLMPCNGPVRCLASWHTGSSLARRAVRSPDPCPPRPYIGTKKGLSKC